MQIRSDLIFFYSKDPIITSLKNSKGMMVGVLLCSKPWLSKRLINP